MASTSTSGTLGSRVVGGRAAGGYLSIVGLTLGLVVVLVVSRESGFVEGDAKKGVQEQDLLLYV